MKFLKRQVTYFLLGFVLAFTIYLFVRFDPDAILLGMGIGAAAGVVLMAALFWIERTFRDEEPITKAGPPAERQ